MGRHAGTGTIPLAGSAGTGGLTVTLPAVACAALLATLTLGATGRRIMGVLVALAGAGMAWAGASGLQPSAETLDQLVRQQTLASEVTLAATWQPWAYAVVAVALTACGVWLAVRPPVLRRRPDAPRAEAELADSLSSWKAMDEGRDPTQHGGERP